MKKARTFRVALFASTGIYFVAGYPLTLIGFPSYGGPVDIVIDTYRYTPEGFTAPLPTGLTATVEGPAESLPEAVSDFGNLVRGLSALLAVTFNCTIREFDAYVGFETTEGSTIREYWEHLIDTGVFNPIPAKVVPAVWFLPVLNAFVNHPGRERLQTSIVQYHHSLQEWMPGNEIPALNHIWIGMETLTRIKRKELETELGLDSQALARKYLPNESLNEEGKLDLNKLDAEIRLQHLFKGDRTIYQGAKKASNAYEHGYEPLWKVREKAITTVEVSLRYLRSAILEMLRLQESDLKVLESEYFDLPNNNSANTTIHGSLSGPAELLDSIDDFPDIHLEPVLSQRGVDESGDALFGMRYILHQDLPEGVEFATSGPDTATVPGTIYGMRQVVENVTPASSDDGGNGG